MKKTIPRGNTLTLSLAFVVGCTTSTPLETLLPLSKEVTAIPTGGSYAYLIVKDRHAVLIDAGSDPSGKTILTALEKHQLTPSDVKGILLTHGHRDSWAAAHLFPHATIVIGSQDYSLLRGDRLPKALLARLFTRFSAKPPVPPNIYLALPGERLHFGDLILDIMPTPGHTPGSSSYRFSDMVFVGESVLWTKDGFRLSPWYWCDQCKNSYRSLNNLLAWPFETLLDGHGGHTHDAHQRLLDWLEKL